MTTHDEKSPRWIGSPRMYQIAAVKSYEAHHERSLLPWAFITTNCDLPMCLAPACMTVHKPRRIEYPREICIYCGMAATDRDHLLPRPATGDALRSFVLTVPSCGPCNRAIGDYPLAHVGQRRKVAQKALWRKNKGLLDRPEKSLADLSGMGYALRSVAIKNNEKARVIRARLLWPEDPDYDVRAFQKSGIEDPAVLGLCDDVAIAWLDRPYWQQEGA
jgi:hypothetical protein